TFSVVPRRGPRAGPYASALALSLPLSCRVPAVAVLRPIECQTLAYKPVGKINACHGAGCNRATIAVAISLNALDHAPADVVGEGIRCALAAAIRFAVDVAKLITFRCIDPR